MGPYNVYIFLKYFIFNGGRSNEWLRSVEWCKKGTLITVHSCKLSLSIYTSIVIFSLSVFMKLVFKPLRHLPTLKTVISHEVNILSCAIIEAISFPFLDNAFCWDSSWLNFTWCHPTWCTYCKAWSAKTSILRSQLSVIFSIKNIAIRFCYIFVLPCN